MEVIHNDDHTIHFVEEVLINFVILQVENLNLVLKENGITEKGIRQKICEKFFFEFSESIDSCYLRKEEKLFSPVICFGEFQNKESLLVDEINKLHVPTKAISLHESALGNSDWYFEEANEDTSEISHCDC